MGQFRLEGSKLENSLGKIRWGKFVGENSLGKIHRCLYLDSVLAAQGYRRVKPSDETIAKRMSRSRKSVSAECS